MKILVAVFALVAGVTSAFAGHIAAPESGCGDHQVMVAWLAQTYGETRLNAHLPNSRAPMEIYLNRQTGSWTILRSGMGGRVCVIAAGDNTASRISGDPT